MMARRAFLAALLAAGAPLAAMPTAVEKGVVVQGGRQFHKPIVLDRALRTEGGGLLAKGSYDVAFESLPGNKVRATFFLGGVRKGEAQGIIIVGGSPVGRGAHKLGDVGFGPEYGFRAGAGKTDLVVGGPGQNQILIGLLLPAVNAAMGDGSVRQGAITGPGSQKVQPNVGAQKVQPAK